MEVYLGNCENFQGRIFWAEEIANTKALRAKSAWHIVVNMARVAGALFQRRGGPLGGIRRKVPKMVRTKEFVLIAS